LGRASFCSQYCGVSWHFRLIWNQSTWKLICHIENSTTFLGN
jgi:hypothetical protein